MNKASKLFFLILFLPFLFYLFNRCANVVAPTGGPRDTIPPIRIVTIPPNQSLNVKTNTYNFEFNERIKVDNLKEQLVITPRIAFNYESKIGKKSLKLEFEEAFHDSTTYTFNFREGIVDITENNPTLDNKYVFSTGNELDSLSIKGYALELLTRDTLENITVGLFQVDDTVTIFDGSPYYFTETDEFGYYALENIKNGNYLIYAFDDGNKNLQLESKSEPYTFIADTIHLLENIDSLNLFLFSLDLRPINLQSALPSGHYFDINYNKYITEYDLFPDDSTFNIYSGYAKEHQSIRIYNTFPEEDSLLIYVTMYDSLYSAQSDTVYVKFKESNRKKEKFAIDITPEARSEIQESFDLKLEFNKPILSWNTDSLFFQFDTTKIATFYNDSIWSWNDNRTNLTIPVFLDKALADTVLVQRTSKKATTDSLASVEKPAEAQAPLKRQMGDAKNEKPKINQGLQLYMAPGSFLSIDGDTSEYTTIKYEFINPEEYGTITGTVESEATSFFIQLLEENNDVFIEVKNLTSFKFELIPPGNYRIRVLVDDDTDGIWKLGNMAENTEPETVYFFPDIIGIRANWELNIDLRF